MNSPSLQTLPSQKQPAQTLPRFRAQKKTALGSRQLQRKRIDVPLPGDDELIEDTVQLFHRLRLLEMKHNGSRPPPLPFSSANSWSTTHDNDQGEWIQFMEQNPLEIEHLYSLMNRMASKFVYEPTWDPDSIREVILIGPFLDRDHHHQLVRTFHHEFQRGASLGITLILGIVQLVRNGPPDFVISDDLIRILRSVRERLEEKTGKDTEDTIYLTRAIVVLLTTLMTTQPTDRSNVELELLLRTMLHLQKHKDTIVKFQARYTKQVLISVCRQGRGNGNPHSTQKSRGLSELLKRSPGSYSQKKWFQDVQKAKGFVQLHLFSDLNLLICEGPSTGDINFQWHVCQFLGEIASDPAWDDDNRYRALALLHEYVKSNGSIKSGSIIRRWALTILRHILELSVAFTTRAGFFTPQAIYDKATVENPPSLFCGLGEKSIKPFEFLHPLMNCLSLPTTSPLLLKINTDSNLEYAIDRLLRQRSRTYDRQGVYIQLLSKKSIHASEDILVELQERARTFLGSKSEVLLVLGDSGAGKSTFGLRLENELWTEYQPGDPIPLFIDLKSIDAPDKDMIHRHLDDLGFFTDQQIQDMQRSRRFILICDGFDEYHKWTNLHTVNRFNKPRQWQSKMIISCRTQYLGPNYRNYFEPETATIGNPDFSHMSDLFEEAVIVPFRNAQIEEYVGLFTQVPRIEDSLVKDPGWSREQYMERLRSIIHLMELAKNPFMLKMILDVLPTIARTTTKMTRVDLYDRFVELHFASEHRRLVNQQSSGKMDSDALLAFTALEVDNLFDLGLDFSKQLSLWIFKELKGVNSVSYSALQDSGSWKDTFFGADGRAKLLRQSAQLVCRENLQDSRQLIRLRSRLSRKRNSYEFSHRSMLEYFYSCLIFDPRGNTPQSDLATCLDSTDSPIPVISHPLGQTNIASEFSIIQFLAERVHQSQEFSVHLQNILELSKIEAATSRAAANAITILIQAGVRFNGADLRGIRVPEADLSGGDFDSAQLQGSDLSNTILRNVWLRMADLSGSNMEGVVFGQRLYLQEGDARVHCCVFSPDGSRFAVGLDISTIVIYDTSTWSRVSLQKHSGSGKSSRTGGLKSTMYEHPSDISSVAYSPCGMYITSGSGECLQLWEAQTGNPSSAWRDNPGSVSSVAFSPSGHQIASGSDDMTVRVQNSQTGALALTLSGHTDAVSSVAYSPTGHQIASGSEDMTVRLWDAQTGASGPTLTGHEHYVTSVVYSPDGQQIASASVDETVRLWDVGTGTLSSILNGHTSSVNSVAYSPDGRQIVSGGDDRTVRLWDTQNGTVISTFSGHTKIVITVAYSPNGQQIASGSYDGTVRLWDVQAVASGGSWNGHAGCVTSVAYSPDDLQIVSGSWDGTVRRWDAQTGDLCSTSRDKDNIVNSVAYSPSGDRITSCSVGRHVRMWDAVTGSLSSTMGAHTWSVNSVAYSPSGHQIALGSWTVRLCDAETGNLLSTLSGHAGNVNSVTYSPNGQQVASSSDDGTVRLWDPLTGAAISTLSGHVGKVFSATYSPCGLQLASGGSDRIVRLWDPLTGTLCSTLVSHSDVLRSVAYSPNGRWIASGGYDKTVRLWEVSSGQCLIVLEGFQDKVYCISWKATAVGNYFVLGNWDKSVRTWKVVENEKEKGVQVCLLWRSTPDTLVLWNALIQRVRGLSEMNLRLFQQRRGAGHPDTQ